MDKVSPWDDRYNSGLQMWLQLACIDPLGYPVKCLILNKFKPIDLHWASDENYISKPLWYALSPCNLKSNYFFLLILCGQGNLLLC